MGGHDPRSSVRGRPAWVQVLASAGVFGLILVGAAAVDVVECFAARPVPADERPERLLTREEFRTAVMGRSMAEVRAVAGVPGRTTLGAAEVNWVYEGRTHDPATCGVDRAAIVRFGAGRVVGVDFRP